MKKFIKEFIKNPKSVWNVFPSSSKLVHSMIKDIDFSKDLTIVEYWPGTGIFTREILKRASKNSKIYVFEIETNFVEDLKKITDERLIVMHEWAENICKHLWEKNVDVIVSWLPFGSLWSAFAKIILAESHKALKFNWIYLQFQYFLSNKSDIFNAFKNHKITLQLLNVPPAFVYKCHKIHN